MGLLTSGFWHATYWAKNFWNDRFWPHFGTGVPTIHRLIASSEPYHVITPSNEMNHLASASFEAQHNIVMITDEE